MNPPPGPGEGDQQDGTGRPGEASQPAGQDPAGQHPASQDPASQHAPGQNPVGQASAPSRALPRMFFADEPEQHREQLAGPPHGTSTGPGQQAGSGEPSAIGQPPGPDQPPASGQPSAFGQPSGPGQPPPFGQPPGLGQPPASGQPTGPGQQRNQFPWAAPGQPGGLGRQPGRRQPGGLGRPAPRPARPRPTRPPDRELRQRAIASLVLGMLSVVALLGLGGDLSRGVYLLIFSAVIGVAACVIGITAVRKARRTGSYRPRAAVGGIIIGALAALLSIPILATYLAFPRQVNNYVKCLNQAQTSGSQQACMDKFYRSIHLGSPTLGSAPADPDPAGSGQRRGPA